MKSDRFFFSRNNANRELSFLCDNIEVYTLLVFSRRVDTRSVLLHNVNILLVRSFQKKRGEGKRTQSDTSMCVCALVSLRSRSTPSREHEREKSLD